MGTIEKNHILEVKKLDKKIRRNKIIPIFATANGSVA